MRHLLAFGCALLCYETAVVRAQTDQTEGPLAPQSQWLSASPDAVQIPKPRLIIRLDMQGVTYVISCTDINAACVDFAGSTSSGGIVDLALDAGGARPVKGQWYLFG